MTYAFGRDLDRLTSQTKKGVFIKKSYTQLAAHLGGVFQEHIQKQKSITLKSLQNKSAIESVCHDTVVYQKKRVSNALKKESEGTDFFENVPAPCLILAPYFFMPVGDELRWLDVFNSIAVESLKHEPNNLYIKLCFDKSMLANQEAIKKITAICRHNIKGVWLWIDDLNEETSSEDTLSSLADLVVTIKKHGKEVVNRHGGFYSSILSKLGMSGICTGVGYGEKRPVEPVVGKMAPVINYYVPGLHGKLGSLDVEQSFEHLNIKTADEFFQNICSCVVCQGVMGKDILEFQQFGSRQFSPGPSQNKRPVQTSNAAQLSRFHYLICKSKEKEAVKKNDLKTLVSDLEKNANFFGDVEIDSFKKKCAALSKWARVLRAKQ